MKRKPNHGLLFGSILILVFLLVACNSSNSQQPDTSGETSQENQVLLPAVEVNSQAEDDTPEEITEEPYPALEENIEVASYPAPEEKAEVDTYPAPEPSPQEEVTNETYPAPEEIVPQPTPRGNELVATDPTTVKLASGQLQLVEMFAFW